MSGLKCPECGYTFTDKKEIVRAAASINGSKTSPLKTEKNRINAQKGGKNRVCKKCGKKFSRFSDVCPYCSALWKPRGRK